MRTRLTFGLSLGFAAVITAVVGLVACVVSPVPQPPNVAPELDATGLTVIPCGMCDIDSVTFESPPGSVTHEDLGNVVIWVANLDTDDSPETFPVAADGSFSITPRGIEHQVYRLQARYAGVELRSPPVDFYVPELEGPAQQLEHPLAHCFVVDPEPELVFEAPQRGDSYPISLRNECDEELLLTRAELRAPNAAFELSPPSVPPSLGPRTSFELEVTLVTSEPGPHEEILLIDVEGSVSDRRAVTLIVP